MINNLMKSLFGTKNDREVKRLSKTVGAINAFEETFKSLSDEQLKAKTAEFKARVVQGETLEKLLPEAFAAVREASQRTLGLRHFDVQMVGGMTLHEGNIAEMRTGEGKTLVATLPAYLNALSGEGVHIITVNDYLATRDANWMRPVFEFLDLKVGIISSMQDPLEKQAAYQADITYGTNNEYGFDYLRDNMALRTEDRMQRGLNFAVVDEVDSILIDEARTPLIISGAAEDSSQLYRRINALIPKLKEETEDSPGDYILDLKSRSAELTEMGHEHVEQLLIDDKLLSEDDSLYAPTNLNLLHHVHSGLRAHTLFTRDIEYIVEGNQVVLIDEHTGRTMAGRRLSEGLHQALEAKEAVNIQAESQTLASTTFQNYFRLYNNLSGMTGTADTEAFEFNQIYGLNVVVIPTNKPVARQDLNDLVFLTLAEKYDAVAVDVADLQAKGFPVLVGTASIESSEEMSSRLKNGKVKHEVLNAKQHDREADIIAEAGCIGRITVATNMAGRGTDIQLIPFEFLELLTHWQKNKIAPASLSVDDSELFEKLSDFWISKWLSKKTQESLQGADFEKKKKALLSYWKEHGQHPLPFKPVSSMAEVGGLHIVGTERHESRRIDNQLRGRAGRQGDPGVSRFYLSLDDPLMRIFIGDNIRGLMSKLGMGEGEAIEHGMVSRSVEKAQRKVEGRNFDIRKSLLEFDDVANDQRTVVYRQRNELLSADDIVETIDAIREDVVQDLIGGFIPPQSLEEQWDIPGLEQHLQAEFGLELAVQQWLDEDKSLHEESLRRRIQKELDQNYQAKRDTYGADMKEVEKQVMLQVLDNSWKEHLSNMDHLRQGINLRAYAQKNPKQEYKRESFELFQEMLENIKSEVIRVLSRVQLLSHEQVEEMEKKRLAELERQQGGMKLQHDELGAEKQESEANTYVREGAKVGRNDPCPCGSGKKFKQCHGKLS